MPRTQIKVGEVVIECDHPKDTMVSFYPAGQKIRSRFLPSRIGLKQPGPYSELPIDGIPGQRIHLDEKNRIARITDPLGDEKNHDLFEKIKRIDKALGQQPNKMPLLPDNVMACREKRFERLTDEDLWTWKFWMRQMLDGKTYWADYYKDPVNNLPEIRPSARLLQGKLPTQEECVASRMVRRSRYRGGNFMDRQSQYVQTREEQSAAARV